VSAEEWENLPEVANIAGKNRKKASLREKFAPVPDSLLPRAQEEMATTLDLQVHLRRFSAQEAKHFDMARLYSKNKKLISSN